MGVDGRPRLGSVQVVLHALEELIGEGERTQRVRIVTRHPDRWVDIQPHGWSVDVAWCSPRDGKGRLPYDVETVLSDLVENTTKATAYVMDVLDINGASTDDVSNWLLRLDDCAPDHDARVFVIVNDGLHPAKDLVRWTTIAPLVQPQASNVTPSFDETTASSESDPSLSPLSHNAETEQPHVLKHLARLPDGFSVDSLRRRILQWRRMGFDVSDLESALVQTDDERERIYRFVENNVRRAVDLDRRLTHLANHLPATAVEHDRFRLRQLTGLDEIETTLDAIER